MSTHNKLYYVYDPMCSWCWGYKPVWQKISQQLESKIEIQYVLGGLAPDSDQPMPEEMQRQIASYWKKIEDFLGTEFNYDFWQKNTPRRSTYPSCRAVLAARKQGAEQAMLSAIQHAYYLEARNPSDNEVLLSLAANIGLDAAKFEVDFFSAELNKEFLQELEFARRIGGNSFPSLFVATEQGIIELQVDYQSAETTIDQVEQILSW
ncbi:DsbA family protein [Vibrio sinaloensis]|uniref:DsbA family protein n=1 Tax=Photobacterium sp. (strain ATCC 43367) TaxID=379097 RepID=UPI0022B00C9E|nr:DsbA family protein [Vibrio sinaloensis]MCZ4292690.1 DsbA family protein [Vibrio sinaloensis]